MAVCAQCGELLPEANGAATVRCVKCGAKLHFAAMSGTLTPEGHLLLRHRSPGRRKYRVQVEQGESYYRKTGTWNYLTRIIDKAKNWYVEHIVEPKTGRVLRHVEEPLDKHRNRKIT